MNTFLDRNLTFCISEFTVSTQKAVRKEERPRYQPRLSLYIAGYVPHYPAQRKGHKGLRNLLNWYLGFVNSARDLFLQNIMSLQDTERLYISLPIPPKLVPLLMADESLEVLTKLIIIYLTTGTTNIALAVPFIANNVQAKYSTGTASFIIFSRVCFHIVPIFLRQYSYKNFKLTKTNDMLIDILWTMQ